MSFGVFRRLVQSEVQKIISVKSSLREVRFIIHRGEIYKSPKWFTLHSLIFFVFFFSVYYGWESLQVPFWIRRSRVRYLCDGYRELAHTGKSVVFAHLYVHGTLWTVWLIKYVLSSGDSKYVNFPKMTFTEFRELRQNPKVVWFPETHVKCGSVFVARQVILLVNVPFLDFVMIN